MSGNGDGDEGERGDWCHEPRTSWTASGTFRPAAFFADVFSKFNRLRGRGELCDITIRIGKRLFPAHKLLLVSCSPYFEAMFLSGLTESRQQEVSLHGIEPDAFQAVLDILYTGQSHIDADNVQSILSAASIFQIEALKKGCSDFLCRNLSPSNCLGIRSFAEVHGCPSLAQSALKHAVSHFAEVAGQDEFLGLGLEQTTDLLSRDDLQVSSEEDVFDAIVAWIAADPPARSEHMPLLLAQVRLPLLPPTVLVDRVRSNPLVQRSLPCRDLLDEALISYHLLPERRSAISSQRMRVRRCTLNAGVIYAVGGLNSVGGSLSSVERFDSLRGRWSSSKPMKTLRSRVGVAVVDKKLYAFGGYDGSSRLCTVECFDPKVEEWRAGSSMKTCRSAMSVVARQDEVFIIGGYDGASSLNTMEVYNVSTDSWRESVPMHTHRSAAGAAILSDFIYVIGGHDGLSIFNTVERFDPLEQQWTMVTPMQSKRCRHGVTAAAGRLFSIGGYDGQTFLNSMECYDPTTNQWTALASMECRRSRVGVAVIASHVYAVGGYDGVSNLNSVEVYNLERGAWSTTVSMTRHQGGVGVAVLPLSSMD